MLFGIPDREYRKAPGEQVDAHPLACLLERVLDALDWFDRIVVAGLCAISRAFVEGSAAYGLSICGFDAHLIPSPDITTREKEVIDCEHLQFDTSYESVDDLIRAIRLKIGTDLQQRG